MWKHDQPEEQFIDLVAKTGYLFIEDGTVSKSKSIRMSMNTLLATLVLRYGHAGSVTASLIHFINKYEYMPGPAAEVSVFFVTQNIDIFTKIFLIF
jgi:hypothetical protein